MPAWICIHLVGKASSPFSFRKGRVRLSINPIQKVQNVDDIRDLWDVRYESVWKAAWSLFEFHIVKKYLKVFWCAVYLLELPSVWCVALHLWTYHDKIRCPFLARSLVRAMSWSLSLVTLCSSRLALLHEALYLTGLIWKGQTRVLKMICSSSSKANDKLKEFFAFASNGRWNFVEGNDKTRYHICGRNHSQNMNSRQHSF